MTWLHLSTLVRFYKMTTKMGKKKEENPFDRQKLWLSDTLKGRGEAGIDYHELYRLGKRQGVFSGSDSMELPRLLHGNTEVSRRETPRVNGKTQKQLFHVDFGPKDALPYSKKPARKAVETPSKRVRSIERDYPSEESPSNDRVHVQPFVRNIPSEKRQEAARVIMRTLEKNPGKWYSLKDFAGILQEQGFLEPHLSLGSGDQGDLKRRIGPVEEEYKDEVKRFRKLPEQAQTRLNNILNLEGARGYLVEFLKASGRQRTWSDIEFTLLMDGFIAMAPLAAEDRDALVKDNAVVVHTDGLSFDPRYWITRRLEEVGDGLGMMPDFEGVIFTEERLFRPEIGLRPEITTAPEVVPGKRTLFDVEEGGSVVYIDPQGEKRQQHWTGKGTIIFIPVSVIVILVFLTQLF